MIFQSRVEKRKRRSWELKALKLKTIRASGSLLVMKE
tara:strand:+ start:559 stop:669 length:111 start_codon:yes stop_codon:yes gene_type:complete